MGVRVIKTGSRAYSSRCGSIDLLQRLDLPLTGSHDETESMLERFGIACAGYYVYPPELTLLAKSILPLPMKVLGRFFNVIGPFLADVPVTAQLTGVADANLLPSLKSLAVQLPERSFWLCANATGADELISFTDNVLVSTDASKDVCLTPGELGFSPGSLEDLSPILTTEATVAHFEAILAGEGPRAAVETVCLNAAAAAMLGGVAATWPEAVRGAHDAIRLGHATRLISALRQYGSRRSFNRPKWIPIPTFQPEEVR
jgi:anthranilate phosphoribosyltransferase